MPIMKAKELRELSREELEQRLAERRGALRNLRFTLATGSVDDVRSLRVARRDIARIKTVLRQREIESAKKAEAQ